VLFLKTFQNLVSLYSEGAIIVCTPGEANGEDLLCRTIIQPDGDVITRSSPRILAQRDVWEEHLKKIKAKVYSIHRLGMVLKGMRFLSLPFLLLGGHKFLNGQIRGFAFYILMSLLFFLTKHFARGYFQSRLRQEMKRTLPFLKLSSTQSGNKGVTD
jgi:hypothetical protein